MKVNNKQIIGFCTNRINRYKKESKGKSLEEATLLSFFISCLERIQEDYKDFDYIGKPVGQSIASFRNMNTQTELFE